MTDSCCPIVFVQISERPARKLIVCRGVKATDYYAYCGENGCDVWGTLASIKGALYEPAGMWLPDALQTPGTSRYVMGVEMPTDYVGPVPEGMEVVDLPPCPYLVFQGQPYPSDQMEEAIGAVWKAIEAYNPEPTGWEWAEERAPRIQLAPVAERGYIEARPVRKVSTTQS